MRKTLSVLLLAICSLGAALAQDKVEVGIGYSYLNQDTKVAVDSPQHFFQSFLGGLNGGDASVALNFGKSPWGIKADVAGYTQSPNFSSNVFTYTAGPVLKKHSGAFNPYAQLLLGFAHKSTSGFSFNGGQNAFAAVAGAGVDVRVAKHLSLKVAEVDYVLTTFHTQRPTDFLVIATRQNNFRYTGGIVLSF